MRKPSLRHPAAVVHFALACAVTSCLQGPMPDAQIDPDEALSSEDSGPIEEAPQESVAAEASPADVEASEPAADHEVLHHVKLPKGPTGAHVVWVRIRE
jgi:hypothetical protein